MRDGNHLPFEYISEAPLAYLLKQFIVSLKGQQGPQLTIFDLDEALLGVVRVLVFSI